MRRIKAWFVTALITFIVGTAVTRAWNALHRVRFDSSAFGSERDLSIPVLKPPAEVERELLEIERQYDIAQTNRDAAFFEKIETDNFVLTYADGTSITRAEDIALMKTWDPNTKFVSDDLHVQVYGNAAIMSGRMTEISPTGSRYSWRWLDLFVRRDGRWQIQSTVQIGW